MEETQEQKIERWHEQANIGKKAALKRERNIYAFTIIAIIAALLILGGLIWAIVTGCIGAYHLLFG